MHGIIMFKFGEKENFNAAKRSIKLLDVNVDNMVISKLVNAKTNSMYLIGYLDKAIRPWFWECLKRVDMLRHLYFKIKIVNWCLSV